MDPHHKRYPKLRFALITENALQMLRPEKTSPGHQPEHKSQPEPEPEAETVLPDPKPLTDVEPGSEPSSSRLDTSAMYQTITNTVSNVVDEKLKRLKLHRLDKMIENKILKMSKLDKIIEDKIYDIQNRQSELRKTLKRLHLAKSDSEISINTLSDFGYSLPKFDSRQRETPTPNKLLELIRKPDEDNSTQPQPQAQTQAPTPTQIQTQTETQTQTQTQANGKKKAKSIGRKAITANKSNQQKAKIKQKSLLTVASKYFKRLDDHYNHHF